MTRYGAPARTGRTTARWHRLRDNLSKLPAEFRSPTVVLDEPEDLSVLDDFAAAYWRTTLLSRAVIGATGVLLPIVFIVGERFFVRGPVAARGSISAYYHSSMRDLFVGGLTVIAFMLATYLAGQISRPDYWLSSLAAIGLMTLVVFPTGRPGLADGVPRCGDVPDLPGCSAMQDRFGETTVATVHFTGAAVFIVSLALISFYWARREQAHALRDQAGPLTTLAYVSRDMRRRLRHAPLALLQLCCGWTIVGAIALVAVGEARNWSILGLTPLYLGEVVSVWAFAVAWCFRARGWFIALVRGWKDRSRRSVPRPSHRPESLVRVRFIAGRVTSEDPRRTVPRPPSPYGRG